MIQKKVCMLGAHSVGKTSLVRRFVHGIFSDRYLTTLGVKIDKRTVQVDDDEVRMLLWDLAGEDPLGSLNMKYLRGSAGYLLVADGTRPNTLDVALDIYERVRAEFGDLPFALALNKADLDGDWRIAPDRMEALTKTWDVSLTSALSGDGVEGIFSRLATRMTTPSHPAS